MPAALEYEHSAWQRLGRLLQQRRVDIDPRYVVFKLFVKERVSGVSYRITWDIEHARRTNYETLSLMALEVAYGWQPGSIERVLQGGNPATRVVTPATGILPKVVADNADDETVMVLWASPWVPADWKLRTIESYVRERNRHKTGAPQTGDSRTA